MNTYKHDNSPGTDDARVIRFRRPFNEKYTLTVGTDIQAGHFPILTKAQIRWALRVIHIQETGCAEMELLTIENRLLESNNPNLKELAALNQAFSRMYAEIHVMLDPNGKLLEILNLPVILGKWEQTKAEMQKIEKEAPALQDIVQLNDEIFASPEKVKLAIEHNEFFGIYFHLIYGEALPARGLRRTHRNLLNSANVDWQYYAEAFSDPSGRGEFTDVEIRGLPAAPLEGEWAREAYKSFDALELPPLNPKLTEKGTYRFEAASGKLLNATLVKEEIACPNFLQGRMTYELSSDDR